MRSADRPPGAAVDILLVEDDPMVAAACREAFRRLYTVCRVAVVPDGAEALAFLRRKADYADRRRPHLVLLDLNMRGMGGRALLLDIKQDPDLRSIPVLVLSGVDDEDDIRKVYDLGANVYLRKPEPPASYADIARAVEAFWLKLADLPG